MLVDTVWEFVSCKVTIAIKALLTGDSVISGSTYLAPGLIHCLLSLRVLVSTVLGSGEFAPVGVLGEGTEEGRLRTV